MPGMMLLRLVDFRYRAYCAWCTLGRTFWADEKEAAEAYVEAHNTGHTPH